MRSPVNPPSPTAGPSRLLWVNHYAVVPGQPGGTRHFELATALGRAGWHTTVLSSDFHLHERRYSHRSGPRDRSEHVSEFEGVTFRWLWASDYQRNDWRRLSNALTFSWNVARYRPAGPAPEVVIGSSPDLFAAWGAAHLARRLRRPFILEVRDLWPESLEAVQGRRGPEYYLLDRLARWLYHRADRIIVVVEGMRRALAEKGIQDDKIVCIPNGVDEQAFPEIQRPARDTLTCVYAGSHGPANGLQAVLDAAELLRDQPRFRFLLVGDGPAKAGLVAEGVRRGLRNVEFRDPVPKREVPAMLAEADVGLLVLRPSPLFELGLSPNKLYDYLASGLPVICNVPGEVANSLRQSDVGEEASPGSGSSLAQAIQRIGSRSPEERRGMGVRGRRWVLEAHGRSRLAQRLIQVLEDCGRGPRVALQAELGGR